MRSRTWITGAAGLLLGLLVVVLWMSSRPRDATERTASAELHGNAGLGNEPGQPSVGTADPREVVAAFRSRAKAAVTSEQPLENEPEPEKTFLGAALIAENAEAKLSPAEIEVWLASGRTNAADLLAVRQAGGGEEYLRLALERFPNDPRVLVAAAYMDNDPVAHRERLDRLQSADPENTLAHYLSARDHLKNGRTEEALADLARASAASKCEDYTADSVADRAVGVP